MASAFLFRSRARCNHLLQLPQTLILSRSMGSGPRTFPGGLTKWQYKRMQEKLAREKANRLLRAEKQLYFSRLRSETRPDQPESGSNSSSNHFTWSKDRIKILAARFTKPGAEDLWNQDDGPVRDPPEKKPPKNPSRNPQLGAGTFIQNRGYSAGRKWRRNPSSDEESGMESEPESELDSARGLRRNPMLGNAVLRDSEYGVERETRPRVERRRWVSEIQQIRDEFRSRNEIAKVERRRVESKGESVISEKRFCLFNKYK